MKDDWIFVGYRQFKSKIGNECNVLDFITKPKNTQDGKGVYVNNVSVFTSLDKYNSFINNNKLLSIVPLSFEIIGNKVRYSI